MLISAIPLSLALEHQAVSLGPEAVFPNIPMFIQLSEHS